MRTTSTSLFLAIAVLALTATSAAAIYTPNPAGRWSPNHFFIAGDFQFNGEKNLDPNGEIEDAVGLFVRPSYAFAENATVYGRVGFQDASHADAGFALGFGLQAAWEIPAARDLAIGASFDYLFWDLESGGGDVDYHEIQFAPAVSYNIPQARSLTPYVGLMANFLVDDLEEDDPVGILFGSNFDLGEHLRFDGQIRVISEAGFFLSAGYLF